MLRSARWRCGLWQAREKGTPNPALQQTAAAMLVPRRSVSHSAAAAAELVVRPAEAGVTDRWRNAPTFIALELPQSFGAGGSPIRSRPKPKEARDGTGYVAGGGSRLGGCRLLDVGPAGAR